MTALAAVDIYKPPSYDINHGIRILKLLKELLPVNADVWLTADDNGIGEDVFRLFAEAHGLDLDDRKYPGGHIGCVRELLILRPDGQSMARLRWPQKAAKRLESAAHEAVDLVRRGLL